MKGNNLIGFAQSNYYKQYQIPSTGEIEQNDIEEFQPPQINTNSSSKINQNQQNLQQSVQQQQSQHAKLNGAAPPNPQQNVNNPVNSDHTVDTKNQQNSKLKDDASVSSDEIQVLDEQQIVDENKNLPRVSTYKTFGNAQNFGKLIDFVQYQFPEIFSYKDQTKDLRFQYTKTKTLKNLEDEEEEDANRSAASNEQQIIQDVVGNLLILTDQNAIQNKNQFSPKSQRQIKRISRELDTQDNDMFQDYPGKKKGEQKPQENIKQETDLGKQNSIVSIDHNLQNTENQQQLAHLQQQQQKQQKVQNQQQQAQEQSNQDFLKYLIQLCEQWESELPEPVPLTEDVIQYHAKDDIEYSKMNTEELAQFVNKFNPTQIQYDPKDKKQKDQDPRAVSAYKDGGKKCLDEKIIKLLRNTGSEMIKKIGRQLLSGDFDLTKLSFPIKVMIPKSGLEKALNSTCLFPVYINRAAQISDPLERLKLVITASLGHFFINLSFLKPLNPIIGETIEAKYPDGTKLYAEQTSHHPPITCFTLYGANDSYKFQGYYNYKSNAGLNSLSLKNSGQRKITFKDGQVIEYNFGKEKYTGSFWGTMRTECEGKIQFEDKQNGYKAELQFGNVKSRPNDYFSGTIQDNNKNILSNIYGSYMGFIDFDGYRYWDVNTTVAFKPEIVISGLESDQVYRGDKAHLERGHVAQAQVEKEKLEVSQRQDAALRKKHDKEQKTLQKKQKK